MAALLGSRCVYSRRLSRRLVLSGRSGAIGWLISGLTVKTHDAGSSLQLLLIVSNMNFVFYFLTSNWQRKVLVVTDLKVIGQPWLLSSWRRSPTGHGGLVGLCRQLTATEVSNAAWLRQAGGVQWGHGGRRAAGKSGWEATVAMGSCWPGLSV